MTALLYHGERIAGSPRRIQRKRTKGWRKPEGAINVTRPSIWGNPGKTGTDYRDWLEGRVAYGNLGRDQWPRQYVLDHVHELRGKDLMCWCREGADCHADVLLRLANPAQMQP